MSNILQTIDELIYELSLSTIARAKLLRIKNTAKALPQVLKNSKGREVVLSSIASAAPIAATSALSHVNIPGSVQLIKNIKNKNLKHPVRDAWNAYGGPLDATNTMLNSITKPVAQFQAQQRRSNLSQA